MLSLLGLYNPADVKTKDGTLLVELRVCPDIMHLMEMRENKQLMHEIKTTQNPGWPPSLEDLDRLSSYFRILRFLCEKVKRPSARLIGKLGRMQNRRMIDVLAIIYGTTALQTHLLSEGMIKRFRAKAGI